MSLAKTHAIRVGIPAILLLSLLLRTIAMASTSLLGTWVDKTLGDELQFLDGTHVQVVDKGGNRTTVSYSLQPPDQLAMEMPGRSTLFHYRIAGNTLVVQQQVQAADQFFGVKKYAPETFTRK